MVDAVITPREAKISAELSVRRVLPYRARRMVGPFTFLDEMGPFERRAGVDYDVLPHPHIGLATVTYLFEGEFMHRDSLGTVQKILPGDVNWMTAGRGIVHSERLPRELADGGRMHGLQAWVALPLEHEEMAPTFEHHARESLPRFEVNGARLTLVAGEAFGRRSPATTHSPLFYLEAAIPAGRELRMDPGAQEAGFYLLRGEVTVDGQNIRAPNLVVFRTGQPFAIAASAGDAFGMLLGGAPLEGARQIFWNFVSSSPERIERAKQSWREQKFPAIPGETGFVPLP